jgi:nucleotide-binding universal stress UspA family protein
MFRHILVCVDSSPPARCALRQAIDLADTQNARLTILTAICRPPSWANTPMTAAGIEPLACELQSEAARTLCDAVDRVPDSIPVTKILSEEPIRDALLAQIKTGRHDLVVLGTRGRRALRASLLGSLSRYALNHADVPILIVRGEQEDEAEELSPAAPATPATTATAAA